MTKKSKKASTGIAGSSQARQSAYAVLEVLSGEKGPTEAAESLSVSLNRYYTLETRGLEGLVKALEPRPRGRSASSPENQLAAVTRERDRLKGELNRAQALVRMAQRAVGMAHKKGKQDPRRKKRGNRGKKVLTRLLVKEKEPDAAS